MHYNSRYYNNGTIIMLDMSSGDFIDILILRQVMIILKLKKKNYSFKMLIAWFVIKISVKTLEALYINNIPSKFHKINSL